MEETASPPAVEAPPEPAPAAAPEEPGLAAATAPAADTDAAVAGARGLPEGSFQKLFEKYPNLERVFQLELPVIVVLAEKTSTLEEVLSLSEGSVIVFKKHNTEPLDILVHNRKIGAGKTIKVGERFGVLVREVGSPRELLTKLR